MTPDTLHSELDLVESGNRELSGEWVVGTDVWKRLKAEKRTRRMRSQLPTPLRRDSVPGPNGISPSSSTTPTTKSGSSFVAHNAEVDTDSDAGRDKGSPSERVIYYIHGGAYYVGNAATHRLVTIGVSKACNARVFGGSGAVTASSRHS